MNVLPTMVGLAMIFQAHPKAPAGSPTEQEISQCILEESGCDDPGIKGPPEARISISHLEYADLIGSGKAQAVVVASTCNTGTAGPDIHAVYGLSADGKVAELPFHRQEGQPPDPKLPVFGNPNYTLAVEQGKLVAHWGDTSDREEPLIIRYKWDGKSFVMESMEKSGPFKTSYDCAKAEKEIEKAICYSVAVSALDVQMAAAYRERLQALPPDQKKPLLDEQRKWLAKREKTCTIYKWWVDCLTDLYTKRIAELKKK